MLVYVDDILCISHATATIVKEFEKLYHLEEGSIGPPPTCYLGTGIGMIANSFGNNCWSMSLDSYIKNTVRIVEGYMLMEGTQMYKANCPFHNAHYHPELVRI